MMRLLPYGTGRGPRIWRRSTAIARTSVGHRARHGSTCVMGVVRVGSVRFRSVRSCNGESRWFQFIPVLLNFRSSSSWYLKLFLACLEKTQNPEQSFFKETCCQGNKVPNQWTPVGGSWRADPSGRTPVGGAQRARTTFLI